MRATGIIRRFDELGRINIPKEIRTKLFGTKYTDGEPMEIFMDKDDIIIRKYEENKDDVCEWTSTQINNEWKPSCEPNSTYNVFGVAWFKRCPYCGKKIKVVDK